MQNQSTYQKIHSFIQEKNFLAAEDLIYSGLKGNPEDSQLFYLRGVLRSFQGRLAPAMDDLKIALQQDPRHTDAAICLSIILNDIGKYDEAKKVFDQANSALLIKSSGDDIEIDRKFSVKHLELGDLYFRHRRYDEAIEEYGKAIALNPTDIHLHIRRAKAFAKKGYVSRAIQSLQELKIQHPTNPTIRLQLGLLHYSQGNVLDAGLEWEQVLENHPENKEAQSYLQLVSGASGSNK